MTGVKRKRPESFTTTRGAVGTLCQGGVATPAVYQNSLTVQVCAVKAGVSRLNAAPGRRIAGNPGVRGLGWGRTIFRPSSGAQARERPSD